MQSITCVYDVYVLDPIQIIAIQYWLLKGLTRLPDVLKVNGIIAQLIMRTLNLTNIINTFCFSHSNHTTISFIFFVVNSNGIV